MWMYFRSDVDSVLQQARCNRIFRPCPLQSSTNLHKPYFPTPSVTTVQSLSSGEANIVSETIGSPPEHVASALHEVEIFERYHPSQHCITPGSLASQSSKEECVLSKIFSLSICHNLLTHTKEPHFSALVASDWLELFVCSAGCSSEHCLSKSKVQLDSIHLTPLSEERIEHSFDLSQLGPGEEIVIHSHANHHRGDNADSEMSVVLAFKRLNPILMRCSWSGPV
jgi:hypothetical protein